MSSVKRLWPLIAILAAVACGTDGSNGSGISLHGLATVLSGGAIGGIITRPPPPVLAGGTPTPASATPVGNVDASFDVNTSGGATYDIPIKVPPGIMGIEPRLSIAYDSQGGDGLAGVGFALKGLSRIERCNATVAQDGFAGAVGFDGNDRFCLDGMRLMLVSAGNYGDDGTLYHTEGETWTQVKANGSCWDNNGIGGPNQQHTGPCTFTVSLKNGVTVTYGGDSALACTAVDPKLPPHPARVLWPMTSMTDLRGNTMAIAYTQGGNHECVPDHMDYTSNMAAGQPAQRQVKFGYNWRADVVPRYTAGVTRALSTLLATVQTYVKGPQYAGGQQLVRQYNLTYEIGAHTLRERLKQISECDGANNCLPPTVFTWQDGEWMDDVDYNSNGYWMADPTLGNLWAGDFNGDGKPDFMQMYALQGSSVPNWYSSYLYTSSSGEGNRLDTQGNWNGLIMNQDVLGNGQAFYGSNRIVTGDVNGDGLTDVLVLTNYSTDWNTNTPNPVGWQLYLANALGLPSTPSATGSNPSLNDVVYMGDFDGDGRADLITFSNGTWESDPNYATQSKYTGWRVYLWNGSSFALASQFSSQFGPPVNGDYNDWNVWSDLPQYRVKFTLGDFNGDGRVDFLATKQSQYQTDPTPHTEWKLYFSTKTGFKEQDDGVWPHDSYNITAGDFNGDGYTDVLLTGGRNGSGAAPSDVQHGYLMLQSTGTTFAPQIVTESDVTYTYPGSSTPSTQKWGWTGDSPNWGDMVEVANLNDDGMDDLVLTASNQWSLSYQGANLLRSVGGNQFLYVTNKSIGYNSGNAHILADFAGTGRSSIFFYDYGTFFWGNRYNTKPDMLINIVDGLKAQTTIDYMPMTFPDVYTRSWGAQFPSRNFMATRYLTYHVMKTDGRNGWFESYYHYTDAQTDVTGHGALGFASIKIDTPWDGAEQITYYRQDYPFAGSPFEQQRFVNGTLVNQSNFWYQDTVTNPGVHFVHMSADRSYDYTIDGTNKMDLMSGKNYFYDAYGNLNNVIDEADSSTSAYNVTTATTFLNDPAHWLIGFPQDITITDNSNTVLSHKQYQYDAQMNVKFEGNWDSANSQFLGTTQTFDAYGNPLTSTDPLNGVTKFKYDAYGYISSTTDPLNHTTGKVIDPRFGNEIQRIDVNGVSSFITTDGFGRTTQITGPDPNGVQQVIQKFVVTSTGGGGYVNQSWALHGWGSNDWDWKEEWKDGIGRTFKTRKRGVGTQAIATDTTYTWMKLVYTNTRPYLEGNTPLVSTFGYDLKRRPVYTQLPSGQASTIKYDDLKHTVSKIEPNNTLTVFYMNPRGKATQRIDANGNSTYYGYDGLSRVVWTMDPDSVVTYNAYDTLGRKPWTWNSALGYTIYTYDKTGHLIAETDPSGHTVWRGYDALDRTTYKVYADGIVSTYVYDDPSLTFAVGQLTHAAKWNNGQLESNYDFGYDSYGHQTTAHLWVDGRNYSWSQGFDPQGRGVSQVYPDGGIETLTYDSGGNPSSIALHDFTDAAGVSNTYAQWSNYSALGRPGQVTLGNNVVTCYGYDDKAGTMLTTHTSRFAPGYGTVCQDPAASGETRLLDYAYGWDPVNNVDHITDNLDSSRTQHFTYYTGGQLKQAFGAYGAHYYSYSGSGNLASMDAVGYTYQSHRMVSGSDGTSLAYDSNGNMISKVQGGATYGYTWSDADELKSVTGPKGSSSYLYDVTGKRLKKTDPDGTVTYYISADYEVAIPQGTGPEQHTKYLSGPVGHVAQVTHSGPQLMGALMPAYHTTLAGMFNTGTASGAAQRFVHWLRGATLDPKVVHDLTACVMVLSALGALALAIAAARRRRARRLPAWVRATAPLIAFFVLVTSGLGRIREAHASLAAGSNGAGVPAAGVLYFHQNHIGSTVMMTDGAGNVTARVEYDPWGNVYQPSSSGSDNFRAKFTGKEPERGNSLVYYDARYYDPTLGRFISSDNQLGGNPLKTTSLNRYAYAGNNPVTYTDPSGHDFGIFEIIVIVSIIIGAIIGGTDGKILSDPAHAFDNWSWTRAIVGAWVGLMVGIVGFALGTLGAIGGTIFGIPASTIAQSAFAGGVISATSEYAAGERDGAKLFAYFGIGLLSGFLSGTQELGLVYQGGRFVTDAAASVLTSILKKAVDPNHAFTFSIWALNFSIDKDGNVKFSAAYMFLATQVLTVGATDPSKMMFDDNKMAFYDFYAEPQEGTLTWVMTLLPHSHDYGGSPSLYGLVTDVMKGIVKYGVARYLTMTGSAQNAFDIINFGVDTGIGPALGPITDLAKTATNKMARIGMRQLPN